MPIVSLTFWTRDPQRSAFELQQVARAVEIELKRIKGTRDVSTIGGPDHVIRVLMDAERMNAFGVTPQEIVAALKVSNALQPSGNLAPATANCWCRPAPISNRRPTSSNWWSPCAVPRTTASRCS